ncbi:glycosyltransferase family 2 protein [Fructilactobacillus carniphilus]|uniref:Glycosyltransferase n=1 Tax=Fructilactobacillus carniphilus TaxID=2940297 RepID=A0ABY5BV05_9LACO|nr:glycosyltransferase family 2 protein [Fructilactobacillus carniphilus]USS90339.1 glycosyltransferase [Fructilactobacillus carniphilus]
MNDFDISIIMPAYNSEKTIGRAIDSIIKQKTKYKFELIVVDDGSKDNTIQIVKRKAANGNNINLLLQDHQFQAKARNLGIKKAKGKFIMFADDDDLYLHGFIEKMGNSIAEKQLVIAGIQKENNGEINLETNSLLESADSKEQLIGIYLTKNQEMDVGLWNKIFIKKVIEDNNISMSNDNFFEDSLFVLDYLLAINYRKIYFINEPLYDLKKRNGSTTNTFDSKLLEKCHNYINKVSLLVNENHLKQFLPAFKARIYLFYIHRNILTNQAWTSKQQVKILKPYISLETFKNLQVKYGIALLIARFLPQIYINLYKHKN